MKVLSIAILNSLFRPTLKKR